MTDVLLVALIVALVAVGIAFHRSRLALHEARQRGRTQQQEAALWKSSALGAQSMLEQIMAHAADALVITDAERRIVHFSSGAEGLFEVESARALGRPFIEVTMDTDLDQLLRSCLTSGKTEAGSVRLTISHTMLDATAVPLLAGPEASHVLLVMEDVTELRKLETARREFVANISHELRVPLAAVKAMVETLLDGALSDPSAATRFLSQMNAEVDNITQLVRELLELSRIESGQTELHLAPAEIGRIAEKAVGRLQAQADQQAVRVTLEADPGNPVAMLDEDKLGQVILNLLHNAIKFTPQGGQVVVRTGTLQDGGSSSVFVSLQDTGVGIPEEDLPRIFERFYKVDKARKRGEGTGLGLAIAKHVVQAHGGQIWAESSEGKGSTFTFTLPWRPAAGS